MIHGVSFSIRHKLTILILSMIVFALLSVGFLYHLKASDNLRNVIYSHIQSTGDLTRLALEQLFESQHDRMRLISSRTQLRESLYSFSEDSNPNSQEKISKIILDAKNSISDISAVLVYSKTKTLVSQTDSHEMMRLAARKALQSSKFENDYVLDIIPDQQGLPVVQLISALERNEHIIGYIVVYSSALPIISALSQYRGLSLSGDILLVKKSAEEVVAITPTENSKRQYFYPVKINPFGQTITQTQELVDLRGRSVFALTQDFSPINLGVIIKVDRAQALGVLESQKTYLLTALIIAFVASALASLLFARRFTKPIIDMTEVATVIARGEIDKRIEYLNRDELGVLGHAFNLMADKLIDANNLLEKKVQDKTERLRKINKKLFDANQKLKTISNIDHLTQLLNRRAFEYRAEIEWSRCKREGFSAACMIIDVDYFKSYNDSLGHQAGDDCLREISDVIQSVFQRDTDLVARFGGEEFIILVNDLTRAQIEFLVANVHVGLREKAITHPDSSVSDRITVSIGIAMLAKVTHQMGIEEFIQTADNCLYRAKEKGRNGSVFCDGNTQ